MPRQVRLDSPGTLYHVMVCGIESARVSMTRRIEEISCDVWGHWLRNAEERSVANGTSKRELSGRLPTVRTKIVRELVENYGVRGADVARHVAISTSGVSKILTRTLSS